MCAGRANSSAGLGRGVKCLDVALMRAADFCILQLRPRKEQVSALWVLKPEDKAANYKIHNSNSALKCAECNNLVTPHFAEKG